MSGKCRKIMYALVVTVFAAFLWMICCENDRKVSDKAIGETTVQSMRSGEKTVSLEQSDIIFDVVLCAVWQGCSDTHCV